MKGKLLSYEEIQELKIGTKVWLEKDEKLDKWYNKQDKVYIVGGELRRFISEDGEINSTNIYLNGIAVSSGNVRVYEWIEDTDEQTITEETNQSKTYKGSEILAMIENGELKDEDMIIDKDNYPWIIKNFTIEDDEECNPTYTLLNYAPFTIKEKETVDFMTAYNSHKKVKPAIGEYIYSDMRDFLEVIQHSSQDMADKLINGKWFIQE